MGEPTIFSRISMPYVNTYAWRKAGRQGTETNPSPLAWRKRKEKIDFPEYREAERKRAQPRSLASWGCRTNSIRS
ncbi:hypothetical protein B0X16_13050 [Listeria monocytogenes]|nr:hypothetical protein B0X16_13050 [Listeria monocytogenes]